MRKTLICSFVVCMGAYANAHLAEETVNAMTWGAETKVTFRVVDSSGVPVTNARMRFAWSYDYTNKSRDLDTKTDEHGQIVIETKSRGTFTWSSEKPGYYKSKGEYSLYVRGETRVIDGRWVPWNPTVKIVLKEKRSPSSLFVLESKRYILPLDVAVDLDFMVGDLVAPFGKGIVADATIRIASTIQPKRNVRSADQLHFMANTAESGIMTLKQDGDSQMKSVYRAPANGFRQAFCFQRNRDYSGSGMLFDMAFESNEYIVIRIRVETGTKGRIVHSKYGKIYKLKFGDEGADGRNGYILLSYFLNTNDNDTNLEWDGLDLRTGRQYDLDKILAPL